ncbi:MAG TPA: NAD-dependent epimerase/dehydratase family protein [Candidatus Cloacimonadota bacterium]|nr:NAD-dependent epimerase/dehydratase family protein [Candidatus Cloacimonadota bacterium]HPS37896.1 NAD-dependent epimerase/dehydratase family protein [Candidatus Cloacimonadota bacterium]
MKILITGGAGFIGSHVSDAYLAAGHDVVVVDDLSSGYAHNLNPKAKFYKQDICSPELDEVFSLEQPDIVNHHAAQISVPRSIEDPLRDARINVLGLINLLQNCMKHHVKKVIFISSGGAIYGEAEEYPTSENYQPIPLSVYAINKMVGESYLYFYQHQYGLSYTVLRYANVYGPRQVSHGEAGVVSIFTEKLLSGEQPVLNAYPEEPEGMIRDYVYVKDVVQANLLALEHGTGEAFNIGTRIETTTRGLYNEICRQLEINIEPLAGMARQGDIRRSLLNFDKANSILGWTPGYTLSRGIAETIEFFKSGQKR